MMTIKLNTNQVLIKIRKLTFARENSTVVKHLLVKWKEDAPSLFVVIRSLCRMFVMFNEDYYVRFRVSV
jgi:hypothetical protein